MANALIPTRPPVNKEHHRWRSTDDVRETLEAKFPSLTFPYLDSDHMHGVRSAIHVYCQHHDTFTRVALPGLLYDGTQYACAECAAEHGHALRKAAGFSFRNYVGKRGVQSGIFKAVKSVFPDAVWEHRMKCGKEIDIWVPSVGAGVEYNGNYYHSTEIQKDLKYHAKKSWLSQKEQKGIFHVFSDEAVEPYSNIVRLVEMSAGMHTYAESDRDVIALCDTATALPFYREWNFIFPTIVEKYCDTHVALLRRGKPVAVISGTSVGRKVLRTATRLYGVPLDRMLAVFQTNVGHPCAVYADMRNPLEVTAWASLTKMWKYSGPIGFPLNHDFSVRFNTSEIDMVCDGPMIYDSGHCIFRL